MTWWKPKRPRNTYQRDEKYLPPLHGGYKPRPGPDGKYRDVSTPPKPPKGSGGGSR